MAEAVATAAVGGVDAVDVIARATAGTESPQAEGAPQSLLEQQLQAAIAERDTNYDRWMRAQAESENYKRRVQRDNEEFRRYHALPLIRDILPALDNLDRAVQAGEISENLNELLDGVKLVAKQFDDILDRHALKPISATAGQPFDPHRHAAVQQIPSANHPPLTVLEEVSRGYVLHDRVVRPSQVIVSAAVPSAAPEGSSDETQAKDASA